MDPSVRDIMYTSRRLSPWAHYDLHLGNWIDASLIKHLELFKSHGFGHSNSLSKLLWNGN